MQLQASSEGHLVGWGHPRIRAARRYTTIPVHVYHNIFGSGLITGTARQNSIWLQN
jgi:hypothetical protein